MAKNMEIALLLDFYGEMLTEKQKDMIELYYDDDLSLSEIAENAGMTRQGVRDSIKKSEAELRAWDDKLHFTKKIADANEKIADAARTLEKLEQTEEIASVLALLRSISL